MTSQLPARFPSGRISSISGTAKSLLHAARAGAAGAREHGFQSWNALREPWKNARSLSPRQSTAPRKRQAL